MKGGRPGPKGRFLPPALMNLDDLAHLHTLDAEDMLGYIRRLGTDLTAAWQLGLTQPLPPMGTIQRVVIAGMGGSAIGADLLATYLAPSCPIPVLVHRDYDLPGWAQGPETLVIASSHSGNTEETLSSFRLAGERGCSRLAICTGGALAQAAAQAGVPVWIFEHHGQPRTAVAYSFALLLAAFYRLKLIPDPQSDLEATAALMQNQAAAYQPEVGVHQNPAKRLAGQLVDRWVVVLASDYLAPVARRWKGQISELAKAWAQFEFLPEADHNTLAGTLNPEAALMRTFVLFLRAPSDQPRNRLRADLTRQAMMVQALGTDTVDAGGETPLAHIWTTLQFGDYVSYYLALAYGVDPTPVEALQTLKNQLNAVK